ncbi:pilus assembly protein PilP [Crenobacter cavernae]|uniref:Pilus assembly protein PilP n=1 Tax=Crenobacter cavernae TaxID=2290923 RepID=A0ABY0FCD5_9NEIS|nr:pilus assembly protein PilP [Crenobacter cavernae]RXZ43758.1 pilus assembly protein PilP [Crenobacter cavernae]
MKKWLAVSLLTALAGCAGSGNEDLDAWMAQAGQGLTGQVDPLPQAQPYQPVVYDNANALTPFDDQKMQVAKRQNSANAPDFNRAREVLENFDLDKLRLVGTLKRNGINYGLIQTPDNTVYRVAPGNFMGPNFGQVKKVGETEVQLSETVEDLNGEWVQRSTSLYLEEQGQK